MPQDVKINAKVGIGPIGRAFGIQVEMKVSIPGMDKTLAEDLVKKADKVCPYSNATRGNIKVNIKVV